MSDPLSSDDGQGGSAGDDYVGDYENLEDRIYNSKRPPSDEEVGKSVRLENWQLSQIEIITTEINTSKAEVLSKAYIHGLTQIRERVTLDKLERIASMRTEFMQLLMSDPDRDGGGDEFMEKLHDAEIEVRVKMENGDMKVMRVPVPRSVMSEVVDSFLDKLSISADFHRLCITVGLADSEHATLLTQNYMDEMVQEFDEAVIDAEKMVEETLAKYVSKMAYKWSEGGVPIERVQDFEMVIDKMETEAERKARFYLESVELDD